MTARSLPSLDEPKRAFKGVWIPSEIWDNKTLSWFGKCLLAEIESLDDGKGCWASNEFLAKRMDSTPESIRVLIYKLTKEEWLTELDPPKDGPKRLLKVIKGYGKNVMAITKTVTAITDFCNSHYGIQMPKNEIYSMIGGDLLGFPVPEIPIESTKEIIPPIVPQVGRKETISDRARNFAAQFWERFPGSKPIGVKRISKHLREAECLLASGISEDQVFRAVDLLRSDEFRRSWVSGLESVAGKWPEISGHLNGKLKPAPVVLAYRTREL